MNAHGHIAAAALLAASLVTAVSAPATRSAEPTGTRSLEIAYIAHDGRTSHATVLLPTSYGPDQNPPIPLVISPHGRGMSGTTNAHLWGDLPGRDGFVVVNPDGAGSHLSGRFSWGAPGQIDDLARMPSILESELPWLRIDHRRVYALGGSMGGQETLLLLAKHPHLLAGAVAVDPMVDFVRQYKSFHEFECDATCRKGWNGYIGDKLQSFARREVGGSPQTARAGFAERSPLTYAHRIATSGVPLTIWWSSTDEIIRHSQLQSGLLVRDIRSTHAHSPLRVVTGAWRHTHPLRYDRKLPEMLAGLGLTAEPTLR
jgi:dipeptidyl aminopeptidase/acylaminoacyl peptidase